MTRLLYDFHSMSIRLFAALDLPDDISDRVMALNYGRPIATGTPAEVQAHPEVIRAYLGG